MLLAHLQELIGTIYDVRVGYNVDDFVITDRALLPPVARHTPSDEQVVVVQPAAGQEEASVALYLDPQLLQRLAQDDPLHCLNSGNVADWCTALEGVSHFLYLAWNAGHDRPVSHLELEMQAEVDKYVASYWLLRRQSPRCFPHELHHILFQRARVDPRLTDGTTGLYREASHYAGRFCRRLERLLTRPRESRSARTLREVLSELRRFYRLSSARKRTYIERYA